MPAGRSCPRAVIVGAGIAGLTTALKLAPEPVTVLSRAPLGGAVASAWAQGGVAAALGPDDDATAHAADTLAVAGAIGDPAVAASVAADAPARIADLAALGARFDHTQDGALKLGREAGHSRRRIIHAAGDGTGREIMRALIAAARSTPSITILEGCEADRLILDGSAVAGLVVRRGGAMSVLAADAVVLATGGIGGLYRETSNPLGARGDGLALAARAGAVLADLEFVQFHPTALDVGRDPMPLVTEALRGEGAVLIDGAGRRFMTEIHRDAELAPRDVVARAIWRVRREGERVFLDARPAIGDAFPERFPTVYAACRAADVDPVREPIPVAPAAHYHMGGVETDQSGRSSIAGLWAVGEVASTGLHGANRLASNSLLEALVFGARAAHDIAEMPRGGQRRAVFLAGEPGRDDDGYGGALLHLRSLMSVAVGVERHEVGLRGALEQLTEWERQSPRPVHHFANAIMVAKLITVSALMRCESRGGHFRSDFPKPVPEWRHRSRITLVEAQAIIEGLDHKIPSPREAMS